jgi:hypothetical protein
MRKSFFEFLECKGVLQLALQLSFLGCNDDLQLTIFLHCECYQINYKNYNSPYIWSNSLQFNCNSITFLSKQLIFNYCAIPLQLLPKCHTNATNFHPSIKILHMALWRFLDFFFLSIDVHHLLWLLMMVWNYEMWHNKKIVKWHIN